MKLPIANLNIAFLALTILACTALHPVAASAAGAPFPAGSPAQETIRFQYAVYFLPMPSKDPAAALSGAAAKLKFKFKQVAHLPKVTDEPVYVATVEKDVRKNYTPPDMRAMQYFAFGLSRQQAESVQNSQQALILTFSYRKSHVLDALESANQLVEQVARESGGLVWDEETRQIFSPDEWRKRRIESWSKPFPDVSRHTTIHAYKDGEYVRAITLGMAKFGLPDVVMQDFPWSANRSAGNLINLFCQAMAEGANFAKAGEYDFNLANVQNSAVRDAQLGTLKPNATSVARLTLRQAVPQQGDPGNRLVEIGFDRYAGKDVHAKQDAMFASLFGSEDKIFRIKHNDELRAVSEKAKTRLPALSNDFNAGLAPGEFIMLKAPFKTDDGGNEWMWVEVTEWKGEKIKGLLKNEPVNVSKLHGGQIVDIRQQDVFDYLRTRPDGTQEGNETSKIIKKMNAP